jgi:hypothetical protein
MISLGYNCISLLDFKVHGSTSEVNNVFRRHVI